MNCTNAGGNCVTYTVEVMEEQIIYEGEVILKYRIEYPYFKCHYYNYSISLINNYYQRRAENYRRYCITELLEMTIEQYHADPTWRAPPRAFEILETFSVTLLEACIISLFNDRYEYTGGAHGTTRRTGDTWNLQMRRKLNLNELFYCSGDPREYLSAKMVSNANKQKEVYFENYPSLISETFNPENFFCMSLGIVVFYQQYDIAPYSSGIREFFIPYTDCLSNPVRMCMICYDDANDIREN